MSRPLHGNEVVQTLASLSVYKFRVIDFQVHKWLPCQRDFIFTKVKTIERTFENKVPPSVSPPFVVVSGKFRGVQGDTCRPLIGIPPGVLAPGPDSVTQDG